MASEPIITGITFIGDTILMKYINTCLNLPITEIDTEGVFVHCDFTFPDQRLVQIQSNLEILIKAGHKLCEKVVIMIGTYDVLDYIQGTIKSVKTEVLSRLINHLWAQNVKEIILCTIPPLLKASPKAKLLLALYNKHIRSWHGTEKNGKTVTVVEIYSNLIVSVLFESGGVLPTNQGCWRIHKILQPYL